MVLPDPRNHLKYPSFQTSSSQTVPDQYIVVFKSSLPDPAAEARALVAQHGGTLRFRGQAITHYRRFLDLLAQPEPELRPMVAEAHRRLRSLDF
jgi:hypothetical protein